MNINSDGDSLRIFINGALRMNVGVNLAEHFVGRDVFVGFTGGAGVAADQQDILTWTMESVEPTGSTLFGARVAETRPPIPPTPPPVNPPVTPPTESPTASPSSAPSSAPTSIAQRAQSFWEWFISVVQSLVSILSETQDVLASRNIDGTD